MSKRFTDTDIWDEDWYVALPNKYKLLWNYVKDRCDNVGIWRPNKIIAQKLIDEDINLNDFLNLINSEKERIKVLPSGKWFVKYFFIFQYGEKFSPSSPVHKSALKQLVANGIHINEVLNGGAGKLKSLDFEQLKEIAYCKDSNRVKEAYG